MFVFKDSDVHFVLGGVLWLMKDNLTVEQIKTSNNREEVNIKKNNNSKTENKKQDAKNSTAKKHSSKSSDSDKEDLKQKVNEVSHEVLEETNKDLKQVLLKKALGFRVRETVQEFVLQDGEMNLTKKKVSVKYYPPDLSAIELILKTEKNDDDYALLSDEELEQEKQNLLNKLKLFENE